ncbi:MAG: geranylgeranyl reductase family protein [Rhodocyclales bacterium]|nr:geranylgeranyl reductase family protein [Rhodocyclales bacterium]
MADTDECDVLVVGLGPAGAAAATAAAKAGARVLAVERRQSLGGVANCPEFIPIPLGLHARADHVVIQSIVGTRNHLGDGTCADSLLPGCVVNRDAFDRALVDFSRAAGAQLRHDIVFAGLDADHSEATLNQNGRSRKMHYRALVAADGHASSVARLLGLPALKKMYTRRYRVALHVPQDAVDVWISPRYPGGYGWLIPAGREAILGTGMEERVAREALDALHRQLAGAGLVGSEVLGQSAGAVPVEGLREKLSFGNILFAGDAGGLAHPLTGAGIHPAVVSGEAAGRAAAEWSVGHLGALPAYEAKMRGQFGETLARALKRRGPLESPLGTDGGASDLEAGGWSVVRGAFEQ